MQHSPSASPGQSKIGLTRELIDQFAAGIERGAELRFLTRASGFSERTVFTWLEIGKGARETWQGTESPVSAIDRQLCTEFWEAVERARSARANTLLESLVKAATTINPKTMQPDWRAADAYLSKSPHTREFWREDDKTLRVTHIRSQQDALAEAFDEDSLESAATALALPVHVDGSDQFIASNADSTARAEPLDG